MKKTVKIIAFVLLIVLFVGCLVLPICKVVERAEWLDGFKDLAGEDRYREELKTTIKDFVFLFYPYFVLLILLALNAFFIFYDSSFQDSIHNFKTKCIEKREQAKQKKYSKLKSKIEKMESDE